jgi:hypothetical protein
MTLAEIAKLLGLIAGFDRRTTGPADDLAWLAVAEAAGWTYPLAERAVVEHFAHSTEWLKPAHITQRIDEAKRAVRAAFQIPPHSAELADDGPAFAKWAGEQCVAHMQRGLAEWVRRGVLPAPLAIED